LMGFTGKNLKCNKMFLKKLISCATCRDFAFLH
jgi:hypothetical protein